MATLCNQTHSTFPNIKSGFYCPEFNAPCEACFLRCQLLSGLLTSVFCQGTRAYQLPPRLPVLSHVSHSGWHGYIQFSIGKIRSRRHFELWFFSLAPSPFGDGKKMHQHRPPPASLSQSQLSPRGSVIHEKTPHG